MNTSRLLVCVLACYGIIGSPGCGKSTDTPDALSDAFITHDLQVADIITTDSPPHDSLDRQDTNETGEPDDIADSSDECTPPGDGGVDTCHDDGVSFDTDIGPDTSRDLPPEDPGNDDTPDTDPTDVMDILDTNDVLDDANMQDVASDPGLPDITEPCTITHANSKRVVLNCYADSSRTGLLPVAECWNLLAPDSGQTPSPSVDVDIQFVDEELPCDSIAGITLCTSSVITTCEDITLTNACVTQLSFEILIIGTQYRYASPDGNVSFGFDKTTNPKVAAMQILNVPPSAPNGCTILFNTFSCPVCN